MGACPAAGEFMWFLSYVTALVCKKGCFHPAAFLPEGRDSLTPLLHVMTLQGNVASLRSQLWCQGTESAQERRCLLCQSHAKNHGLIPEAGWSGRIETYRHMYCLCTYPTQVFYKESDLGFVLLP